VEVSLLVEPSDELVSVVPVSGVGGVSPSAKAGVATKALSISASESMIASLPLLIKRNVDIYFSLVCKGGGLRTTRRSERFRFYKTNKC
jgi:hypothetical protein